MDKNGVLGRRSFQAVLFDMDGLMVDSEPLAREAWRLTVAALGREMTDAILAEGFGMRYQEFAVMVCKRLDLPLTPEALLRQTFGVFLKNLPGRLAAMPGLALLLNWLKQGSVTRALVTSGVKAYADIVLRDLELGGYFAVVVTGDDVREGKPAPECYLLAAERLGLAPADCLVLEDAPNGIQAAKAAGMTCWAVPNTHTRLLDVSQADQRFSSLEEVYQALAGSSA